MKTDNTSPPDTANGTRGEADYVHNLIQAARSGDENAFAEIVTRYEKLVYNLAIQYTKNPQDALDVSQEVFIKLWRSLQSFRGNSSFSTWLYRITKNACLDYLRSRKNRAAHLSLTADETSGRSDNSRFGDSSPRERDIPDTSADSDPQRGLERHESRRQVRQAISSLPDAHREILVLRDMRGYTYAQIAEITGLEPGTVKSRISRARQNLRELLEKGNFF